ncbi:MAG: MFS transporter [bacterium]|nr:MFS transporter [bacterium]
MAANSTNNGAATFTGSGAFNRWLVLAVICIPIFVGSLDLTVVSAFLPELILDLELPPQSGIDDAAWILTAYLVADTIGLTFMGRFSDLYGRRRVYTACMILFIIGSVLVAVAHLWPTDMLYGIYRRLGERPDRNYVTLQAIILGRVVQAFGAGALVPVTLALVSDMFPAGRRARPLGLVGAVDTLGWVLGHLYGGLMIYFFAQNADRFVQFFNSIGLNWPAPDWRALFWINVPLMIFSLVVMLVALRRVPMQRAPGRFDYIGALLITGAMIVLNVGLGANVEIPTGASGFEDLSALPPYAVPLVSTAIVLFLLFVLVEARVRDPLVDLKMFRKHNISAGLFISLIVGYCLFIGLVVVPILVNVRLESFDQLSNAALQVGILLSALTIPMSIAALIGGFLNERIGPGRTTALGLTAAIIGFVLIWQTWYLEIPTSTVALEMVIVGFGFGLTFSPISSSVINAASVHQRGVASALVIILRAVGMTVSVSSLTAIALQRINSLVALELQGLGAEASTLINDTYARITVQVLGELGLLGAVLCGVALLPALLLRHEPETDEPVDSVVSEPLRQRRPDEVSASTGD